MTEQDGQTVTGDRAAEVAEYVEAVRDALQDLPPAQRDDLLEDLPTHLAEVAAEDPAPLRDRLGEPAGYAAELRAAADPGAGQRRPTIPAWAAAQGERLRERWRRIDVRVGPLLGYPRLSEFARLLIPAWWVLRGYLAAMVVVTLLDDSGRIGLLPRLGGSTLVGLVVLAGFVAGSVWLAHRQPRLARWPRRAVFAGSALLILVAAVGFASLDDDARFGFGHRTPVHYPPAHDDPYARGQDVFDPYEHVEDVFVIDEHGRALTGVRLLDQHGNPMYIGSAWCDLDHDESGEPILVYPRCPEQAPWWWTALQSPVPDRSPLPEPTGVPTPEPTGAPTGGPDGAPPMPTATPAPGPSPSVGG